MGKRLECLVKHVAYPKGEEITLVSLDVLCKYTTLLTPSNVLFQTSRTSE